MQKGFTLIEILVSVSILLLVLGVVVTPILTYRKTQALQLDTDTITAVLHEARNQTLSSKNATTYGVRITPKQVVMFTGSAFVANGSANKTYFLNNTDTIITISLNGGGSDVVFNRLTGETNQYGTITVSSPGISKTKTVTIYKTGLVE